MLAVFPEMKLSLILLCTLLMVLPLMQGCDSGADDTHYYNYVAPLTGETVEDELSSAMVTRRKLQEGKEML